MIDMAKPLFDSLELFLSDLDYNYNRTHDIVDLFNKYKAIIKLLPINQRVKNQRYVLIFSSKINEEAYLVTLFNQNSTVSNIGVVNLLSIN